jgi:hypothetical protein
MSVCRFSRPQDAPLAARIEVATHTIADLDRRLNQVDTAIEEAAKRGKTNTALSAIEAERKAHASWPPSKLSAPPWPPKAAALRPRWHLSGTWPNSSAPTHTARLLILMMVLCRDPLALTAAASARGAPQ